MTIERPAIAKMIDHAVLHPSADDDAVRAGAEIALKYDVASLCVRPTDLPLAADLLKGSNVALSTVIGFPHGSHSIAAKQAESAYSLEQGAVELDIVLNISRLVSGDLKHIELELKTLSRQIHDAGQQLKIIFETCYLTDEQIRQACMICNDAAVDWVKTSTGFGTHGAKPDHVELMRLHADPSIAVKASGGIRDLDTLMIYRDLGCNRIGTSSTIAILEGTSFESDESY